jgi:hypothetical protein
LASHGGQSLSTFMAYGLARKGKATSDVTFSLDDPPKSYNSSVYTRISSYASETRSVQGPEWDLNADDIDGPTIMRIGQGKEAWAVLAWRWHPRVRLCSNPLRDPSRDPNRRPGHMPMVVPFIEAGRCTLGLSYLTLRTMIFT